MNWNHLFNEIIDQLGEGICILDEGGKTLYVNQPYLNLLELSHVEVIGSDSNVLMHTKRRSPRLWERIAVSLHTEGLWEGEVWFENESGKVSSLFYRVIRMKEKGKEYIVEIFRDIGELKWHQEQHQYLKYHDPLLDLPNQAFLEKEIDTHLKYGISFSLVLLTVDNLKVVNDIAGRETGDQFLSLVTERLKKISDEVEGDLYFVGWNHFIFLTKETSKENLERFVSTVVKELTSTTLRIGEHEWDVRATAGICNEMQGKTYKEIMDSLYIANEAARKRGSTFLFYKKTLREKIVTKHKIEALTKQALNENRFVLFYQPRIDLVRMKVTSAEALIRMISEDGSLVPPGVFIPVAEESDLIVEIGRWVLERVLDDARYITTKSGDSIKFSVNVSANQFLKPDFVSIFEDMFRHAKIDNTFFEVEITEWALMKDIENTIRKMHALKDLGFDLIIDDFGTGYSSLAYLKDFPIDYLKIDKSFVDGIPTDGKAIGIAKSIIFLARQLGMKVTVEGVEHLEQFNWVKENGCDEIQGYYLSKPLGKDDFVNFLKVYNETKRKEKYFQWEDTATVGIPGFDAHHMIIFNILNKIFEEVHLAPSGGKTDLIHYIDMLRYYIKVHFSEEEAFLARYMPPDFKMHVAEHREFEKEIDKIRESLNRGIGNLDQELFRVLRAWWQIHILQHDRAIFKDKSVRKTA